MKLKSFLFLFFLAHSLSFILGFQDVQGQTPPNQPKVITPESLQYTTRMNRALKDMEWSETYYKSYLQTRESSYLILASAFCAKAIVNYADIQQYLPRTTAFYNQADQKRLQACQFYDKLQKKSFLLTPENHLPDSGPICD